MILQDMIYTILSSYKKYLNLNFIKSKCNQLKFVFSKPDNNSNLISHKKAYLILSQLIEKLEPKQENILAITDLINIINDEQSKLNCAQNARVYRVKLLKVSLQKIDLMSKESNEFKDDCLKKLVVYMNVLTKEFVLNLKSINSKLREEASEALKFICSR